MNTTTNATTTNAAQTNPCPTNTGVATGDRDRGSVLPLVLVLMIVGGLTVTALLTFASTLLRNRPPIAVRDETFLTAKSAMEMAISFQREEGPAGCYDTQPIDLNGYTANVTCTPTANFFGSARGRLGLITTSNVPTDRPLAANGAAMPVKDITGDVFINGGVFDGQSADVGIVGTVTTSEFSSVATNAARYDGASGPAACSDPTVETTMQFPNPGVDWTFDCQTEPWWSFAGDQATVGGPYSYPELPPLPTYARPNARQAEVGTCDIYYPGRYDGGLVLAAGDHYFASGLYYFEQPLVVQPGAVVTAGEGQWAGCSVDAEAVFAPGSPQNHEITGKGATFVLGGSASIVIDDASMHINRRVSDPGTRGTEGVAIRSVNFSATPPVATATVEIPNDVVYVSDVYDAANPACDAALDTVRCLQAAADHQVQAGPSAPIATYTASTLTVGDTIVDVDQDGGTAASNSVVAAGAVFVPNARVELRANNNDDFRIRFSGGVTTSGLDLDYEQPPIVAGNFFVGVSDEPIQRQVDLFVEVIAPNGARTVSRATVEVNINGSYAINSWTVDPAATGGGPSPDPCAGGQTVWNAQYWNDPAGASGPNDRLGTDESPARAADLVRTDPSISFDWSNDDAPVGSDPTDLNDFSARWTRLVSITDPGTHRFTISGDDGVRVHVDGVEVPFPPVGGSSAWGNHATKTFVADVELPNCLHTIVVEYYEDGGHADVAFDFVKI